MIANPHMEEVEKISLEVRGELCSQNLFLTEFCVPEIIFSKFDHLPYHRGRSCVTSYLRQPAVFGVPLCQAGSSSFDSVQVRHCARSHVWRFLSPRLRALVRTSCTVPPLAAPCMFCPVTSRVGLSPRVLSYTVWFYPDVRHSPFSRTSVLPSRRFALVRRHVAWVFVYRLTSRSRRLPLVQPQTTCTDDASCHIKCKSLCFRYGRVSLSRRSDKYQTMRLILY